MDLCATPRDLRCLKKTESVGRADARAAEYLARVGVYMLTLGQGD